MLVFSFLPLKYLCYFLAQCDHRNLNSEDELCLFKSLNFVTHGGCFHSIKLNFILNLSFLTILISVIFIAKQLVLMSKHFSWKNELTKKIFFYLIKGIIMSLKLQMFQ